MGKNVDPERKKDIARTLLLILVFGGLGLVALKMMIGEPGKIPVPYSDPGY